VLGPITLLKLKFSAAEYARPLVTELWFYPDGSRILELSIKCPPSQAFQVAAEGKGSADRTGHRPERRAADQDQECPAVLLQAAVERLGLNQGHRISRLAAH
jgi:hypothetical protein